MEVKEVKEAILYQVLGSYNYYKYYYNKIEKEIKVKKEYKRNKFYIRWERNIKRLKGLILKVLLNLKRFNLSLYNLNFIN